jgi:hypothetical protein
MVPRRKPGMRTKAPRALPSRSRQGRAGPGPGIRKAPFPTPGTGLGLYTADGARKYVTASEREAFLREAERADRLVRTLCMTLAYAGSPCPKHSRSPPTVSTSPPACLCSRP